MRGKRDEKWIFAGLWVVFFVLGEWISHEVLPPDHWGGTVATQILAPLLASAVGTLYLRTSGRSLEARPKITWLNARRLMIEAPKVPFRAIGISNRLRWLALPASGAMIALLLWMHFFVIGRDEQGIVSWPVIVFFALATALCAAISTRPAMQIGAFGISGLIGTSVAWNDIGSCRIQTRRSAWGHVSAPRVSVLDKTGNTLASYSLSMTKRDEQRDFLIALHQALQPHEAAPLDQVEQVLAGIPGPK